MASFNYNDTKQASKVLISKVYQEDTNEKVKDVLEKIHLIVKNDVYQNMSFFEYLVKSTPSAEKQKWEEYFDKQLELNNKFITQVENMMQKLDIETADKKMRIIDVLVMGP